MSDVGSGGESRADESRTAADSEQLETGSELLLEETREEVVRLATHPIDEIKRLEHVADEGESAATPLIIAVGIVVVVGVILVIVLTVTLLAYYKS